MAATDTLVAGRYRVGTCLGKGGMGRVWLARDELLRRDVAIKEIALPFGLTDEEREEMRERTLREARAAARLSHPNVVRIYDVQPGNERPWIVMEYVPSRSLLEVIQQHGPLPVAQVAGIGLAVLSALDAANRAGVVHRDVKPSNVLIADDGRVVLTDFGSAMIDEGEGALTRTGVILGSPRYIAPERARNGIATPESDMWSLGATLYEAVEGRAPYTRETTLETLVALATEKPDPVRRAGPLRPVLNGLLQKNPHARMRPAQVEARLRRIADVQNAVRLNEVPAPRRPADSGETWQSTQPAAPWESAHPANSQRPVHLGDLVSNGMTLMPPTDIIDVEPLALPSGSGPRPVSPAPARPGRPAVTPPLRPPARRRGLVVAGAAAALALVLGTVGVVVYDGRDGATPTTATAGTIPTATPPSAAVSPPAPTSTTLPAGFGWYTSRSGFGLAYPRTYGKIQENRTSVTFCAPGGPPVVSVRTWYPSDPDLSLAVAREESAAKLGGYQQVGIAVAPAKDGAAWEYTFTDPKVGRLHGLDRFVMAGGRGYVIQFRTPADRWQQNSVTLDVITDAFRPAAGPFTLPAGFAPYTTKAAFKVSRPLTWGIIKQSSSSVTFCAPGGPPVATIQTWQPSDVDLQKAMMEEEMMIKRMAKDGSYQRIGLQVLPDGQGAALEYVLDDPTMGGLLHGIERVFLAGGRAYLVDFQTPIDKWTENLTNLGGVMRSFRPGAGAGNA